MNKSPQSYDGELPDGSTSIRFGSARLRPMEEPGHYGLYRPFVLVRKDGEKLTREQLEKEVGPLAIYRRRGPGDKVPDPLGSLPTLIRTAGPDGEPFELILIWRPDVDSTV